MSEKIYNPDSILIKGEWHPTKNGTLSYDDLKPASGIEVWWFGSCGHEWQTKMFARAVRGAGCPFCSNRELLVGFNDIATLQPEWIGEWSPNNNKLVSDSIAAGKTEYLWLCNEGHEYSASFGQKEKGRGCPYCKNMKLLPGFNDLGTVYPKIAKQWHPTLNALKTPQNIIAGGREKHWWLGDCGHSWETTIRHRKDGAGCHYCAGQKIAAGVNDLLSQNPLVASEWHPTANGDLKPSDVMVRSTSTVWWMCDKGHEWEAKVLSRTSQGSSCKECREASPAPSIQKLHKANPLLVAEWHPTKNSFDFVQANKLNTQKYWWLASCGHEWEATMGSRKQGNGCAVCVGLQVMSGVNDLAAARPDLAAQWHPIKNGHLTPEIITKGSSKKVWWLGSCDHEWEASPAKRDGGRGCPVCSGHKIVLGLNDLVTLQPELVKQWHPTKNGELKPDQVTGKGGRSRAWWQCDKGHEWEAQVQDRIRGRGCAQCWAHSYISKAEQEIHDYVQKLDPNMVVVQSDKKVLKGQELDIYVPGKNVAVEFNGLYWHSENAGKGRNYHYNKWLAAKEVGVQLIQVWEDDWNRNPEQVKRMVAHKLGLSAERKVFARKTEVGLLTTGEAQTFLERNHVQGFSAGSYYLGLFDKGKLLDREPLAVLVVKWEAGSDRSVLNIIRYATSVNVVGGFTKLLSYADREFMPSSFLTFADNTVSNGGLYVNNGFVADKFIRPDYMYVVDNERKHKFGYRLKKFRSDPDLLWDESMTERELADLNGLERVWDAGKTRYVKPGNFFDDRAVLVTSVESVVEEALPLSSPTLF